MTYISSSRTDLILTSHSNLVIEFGLEKSLYIDSYHHCIAFGMMNLNVSVPPPYAHKFWDYNKNIQKKYPEKYENL